MLQQQKKEEEEDKPKQQAKKRAEKPIRTQTNGEYKLLLTTMTSKQMTK